MKSSIQRLAVSLILVALTIAALGADKNPSPSADKERQAIAVLKSQAPPAEKALACKHLAIYGTPAAVPMLASLLADPELSSWARIALEAIPGKVSDEALRTAIKNTEGILLVGVINSIGVRRDAKAVSALAAKLNDPDREIAAAAAIALGRIGDNSAAKALQRTLAKSPPEMRPALALGCILCAEHFLAGKKFSAATKLYDAVRQADVPEPRKLEALRGSILARQAKGLPLLLETLRSPDHATFSLGLHTARELPGRPVTDALAMELPKTPANRQGPLLLAIADRDDEAVLPAILNAVRSGSTDLRLQAIAILARLGKPEALPVLFDTLADSNGELAGAAKAALANWTTSDVDTQLCNRLPNATGNQRRLLVELAGQRHVAAALPELTKAADDSDAKIRAAGVEALGETVSASDLHLLTDQLAKAKSEDELADVQAALESAVTRIPDKNTAAGKLMGVFRTSPTAAKCCLLRVFGVIANPASLAAVQSSLNSSESAVQDTAVRVLADWSEPAALPPLFDIFCNTTNESHRFLALRGCVRLLDDDAISAGRKLKTFGELIARTQRSDDRKAILSGLGNVADPAALKLVEPLLADPDVQTEAELAYINIAAAIAKSAPAEAKAAATRLEAESKSETVRNRAAKILRPGK
jgi:HEAT repeat protein